MLKVNNLWFAFSAACVGLIVSIIAYNSSRSNPEAHIRNATITRGRELLAEAQYCEGLGLPYDESIVLNWVEFYELSNNDGTQVDERMIQLYAREFIMGMIYRALSLSDSDDPFACFEPDAADLLREALTRWVQTKEQDLTLTQQERFNELLRAAGVDEREQ